MSETGSSDTLTPLVHDYIAGRIRRAEILARTAREHRYQLDGFAASFGSRPLTQLGPRAVERWLETIAHMSPSSRSLRLSTLRGFARWMVTHRHASRDFTADTPRIRRQRLVTRDMTADHFRAILDVVETPRQRVIVWLMFGLGLRCVEISRLTVDDFDFGAGTVVVTGKGGHERELPVGADVRRAVNDYLDAAGIASGRLIRNEGINPLGGISPERVSGITAKLIDRAGLKTRRFDGRSAHGLRAAAATDLFDACGNLRVVQEFLGHTNIATTSIYLRKAGVAEMRDALALRHFDRSA